MTNKTHRDHVKIFLNGLDCRYCQFSESDDVDKCMKIATKSVPMPDPVPDMPVCEAHFNEYYSNWSLDDSLEIAQVLLALKKVNDDS